MPFSAFLRSRLLNALASAALLAIPTWIQAAAPESKSALGRSEIHLDTGWRFRFGGDPAGVTEPGFDDHAWQPVDVPHSWNHFGEYAMSLSATANNAHGVGWYRLRVDAPARAPQHRQYLQFDAVGNIADVWVNGIHLGQHAGAFARFRFDVTDQLRPGATNQIVVKADNSKPEIDSSTQSVVPLAGDFFVHGGIYRRVSLIDADSAQIDLLDHGGPGVYVSTPRIDAGSATVALRVKLANAGNARRALGVATTIRDAQDQIVAADTTSSTLAPRSRLEIHRDLSIANPHLWQGRFDPYLYRVTVELRERGKLVDRVEEPLGVRSFRFDPNEGFFLNGKSTPLHGASRHQDRFGKGWALSPSDHAEDMALMAEMGVNTVRQAHYQHAQEWSDSADRAGMVVWAEVPFVHQSSLTNDAPTAELIENAKSQLTELIRQNYNHPSIMLWSVGNEVDIRATQLGTKKPAQSLVVLQTLNALAKHEDPTRVTAYADCCEDTQALAGSQILSNVADVTGYNRYYGWYYGEPAQLGAALDRFHARYPAMPVAVSEYGAGGATSQHTDNPMGGPVNVFGRPHPEEYESWVHEESWKMLEARHYLAAAWIWNMFDFSSDSRQEGDAIYLNDKGLVTSDRKIRKDVFYFYKSQWSTDAVVHITGRRYIDRAYPVVDVRVYSNAEHVTLRVNGEARGEVACPERICVLREVALRAGRNVVEAAANIGGKEITDKVEWNAPPAAGGFHIAAGTLTGMTGTDGSRYGSDNFFVGGTGKALNPPGRPGETNKNPKVVTGASEAELYGAYREGAFKYDIPLANGKWQVVLHFVEPDPGMAKARSFDVVAQGNAALKDFNPSAAAGAALRVVERRFPVVIRNGRLLLDFMPRGGPAVVSAIAITPVKLQ